MQRLPGAGHTPSSRNSVIVGRGGEEGWGQREGSHRYSQQSHPQYQQQSSPHYRRRNDDRLTHASYQISPVPPPEAPTWRHYPQYQQHQPTQHYEDGPLDEAPDLGFDLAEFEERLAQPSAMLLARMEASKLEAKAREQVVGRLDIEEIFSDIKNITNLTDFNNPVEKRVVEQDSSLLIHEGQGQRLGQGQPLLLQDPGQNLSEEIEAYERNADRVQALDQEQPHVDQKDLSVQETKESARVVDDDGDEVDEVAPSEEGASYFSRQQSMDSQGEKEGEESKGKDKRPVSDCRVCGDRAIAHMHYGGICCYSCKAFFRRAVQSGKDKVYRCKRSGNCQVSLESRRSCQKCRFLKCLSVGMTSAWVLSEEQCTIRFGKNPGKCGRKRRISHSSDHEEEQKQIFQNHLDIRYILSDEDRRQVEQIVDLYEASKEMISFSENNHALWDKIFNKEEKHAYSANEISSLVSTLIKKNIFFIESNFFFKQFPPNDQHALLAKNMTEMCHLRGALRFDPSKGSFQWYFNQKDQRDPVKTQGKSITEGDISNFYSSSEAAKNIVTNIERIVKTELPTEVLLMMMHVVVFSGDGVQLVKAELASTAQVHYLSLIQSNVMALLVDLRETGEKSASAKINSRSLRTQSAASE